MICRSNAMQVLRVLECRIFPISTNTPHGQPEATPASSLPQTAHTSGYTEASTVPKQPQQQHIMQHQPYDQPFFMHPAPSQYAHALAQKLYDLPTFSGQPEQWPLFAAAYRQSTEAFGYTPLQNLFRLQQSLHGAAKESVCYLLIDPANVDEIMDSLEFSYGRPQLLIQDQLVRIRAMPVLQERNTDQFIVMASRVRNSVALLNKDASRHVLSDTTLLAELVSKLPHSKKEIWAEYASRVQPRATAVHFSTWITERARCLTLLDVKPSVGVVGTQPKYSATPTSTHQQGKPVLLSFDENAKRIAVNNSSRACAICTGSHRVITCQRFIQKSVSDRWASAKRLHLCFGCLRGGHLFENCRSKKQCSQKDCRFWHHETLHSSVANESLPIADLSTAASSADPVTTVMMTDAASDGNQQQQSVPGVLGNSPVLFRVVPVSIYGKSDCINTYALIDEGSSFTAIDAGLAESLGLRGPVSSLKMQFIGQNVASQDSQEVDFEISGRGEFQRRFAIRHARTVLNLNLPIQSLTVSTTQPKHAFLRNLSVLNYQNATPKLLIGLDYCQLGVGRHPEISEDGTLVAAKTPLGWIVYGTQEELSSVSACFHCRQCPKVGELEREINEYYSTESFGVKAPLVALESEDDIRARRILAATTKQIGDRYQTGLLWRSDNPTLPPSREMALQRLESILRKLRRDPEYAQMYKKQIESYIKKGYARKLSPDEARTHDSRTWYLPHFAVRSASKPGKLRLVFDAAAVVRGTSLNASLLKGPDLNQPLIKILHQFRLRSVGVVGDIAEMFCQVEMQPSDRRSQRFLWKDCDQSGPPDEFEMCVMTFGACCSPTLAQFVKNTNATRWEDEFSDAGKAIRGNHYVDDFVASFDSADDAIRVTQEVAEVHRRGGFNLRGFVSNCSDVIEALSGAKEIDTVSMYLSGEGEKKILGLRWDIQRDQFVFMLHFDRVPADVASGERWPTKREILSATMSVFDPFGFLADFTLQAKLIIQELWRSGVMWDEIIPEKLAVKWHAWIREVENLKHFHIPRCYSPYLTTNAVVQLHIFADASESAFAAVAYWRVEHAGQLTISFIVGKSRCAPIKQLTVPRLELQAAVLAVRLYQNIIECHDDVRIDQLVMWTDSRTVLHWISSTERRFKTFVAHRIAEILDGTGAPPWRWVPTGLNVADDATRGCEQPQFDPDSRWLRGPAFLLRHEREWPTIPTADDFDPRDEKVEGEFMQFVGLVAQEYMIDFQRFSSFKRLRRTAALILRFISNARVRKDQRQTGVLAVAELNGGTRLLCRLAQMESYPKEYADLKDNKPVERTSTIRVLRPYMDDDKLIRLYGRTDLADAKFLPPDAKRPVLLPRHHRLTELIVSYHHERMGHQLENAVICAVRCKYWVPHLRMLVRRIRRGCQHCMNRSARPKSPIAGQLPIDRLTPFEFPFKYTGLDYFGPVRVTVGRRREKRWIALFTCLTTRAVHMEIAADLTTDACLMTIKNFANIRGIPARIRSDRGTNFVGADGELRRFSEFFDIATIKRELSAEGIEWLFNCPANPEAGGAWERLVQSTKRILAETLKEVAPRVETLRSLVIEAANILNSRPLTDIPVSPEELDPLTPNHFLLGRANSTTTVGPEEPKQLCSRRQWIVCQQLTRTFWRRWMREYLPVLTRRTKEYPDMPPIREGDLVLICDDNQSRGAWSRGRIERTIIGADGIPRLADVITSKGRIRRPLSKLAKLDVEGERVSHGVRDVGEQVIANVKYI